MPRTAAATDPATQEPARIRTGGARPAPTKTIAAIAIFVVTLVALSSFGMLPGARTPGAPTAVPRASGTLADAIDSLRSGAGPAGDHPLACQPVADAPTARCGPTATPVARAGWNQLGTTPQDSGWLAYDPADHYAVFLGAGFGGAAQSPQTWTYTSSGWTELPPLTSPSFCGGAAMTYDSSDKYVLLLEGANCTDQGQTWTFSAGVWTHVATTVSPRNVSFPALTDDPASGAVVLFGGGLYDGPINETWSFSAGSWTNQTSSLNLSPPARYAASFAYDGAAGYAVLFGGNGPVAYLNDTWELHYFSGKYWWTAGPTSGAPPPREFAPLVPTPTGNLTLFGGEGFSPTYHSFEYTDSWRFAAGAWSNQSPDPMGGGRQEIAPFDGADDLIAVDAPGFAGYFPPYAGAPAVTWNWSALTDVWANSTPRSTPTPQTTFAPSLVYDAADGYVVMFGSDQIQISSGVYHFVPVTWSYKAGVWANLTNRSTQPLGRIDEGLVYDAADGYVLMFGGLAPNACGPFNAATPYCGDTWEFAGGLWRQLSTGTAPLNRSSVPMAYDAADGYVVLTGGLCQSSGTYIGPHLCNDTWTFSAGNWTNVTTTSGTQPNAGYGPIAYDSHDAYVLLLCYPDYTSTFVGGKWTNRTGSVGTAPSILGGGSLVDDPSMGYVLWDLVTQPAPSYPQPWNFDWSYQNGSWTNITGPTPVPVDAGVADTYDAADHYVLRVGILATNDVTGLSPYWNWTNTSSVGGTGFSITGFTASPATLDVGGTTTLTVTYSGGTGPYNFTYSSMPPGCASGSSNASSRRCAPTTPGNYDISVVASDARGNRSAASLSLHVNAALALSGFDASPANLTLGSRTLLDVSTVGGTAPLSYSYAGLPVGCATQSIPLLPCQPSGAGNYSVSVNVSDAAGDGVLGFATVHVAAAGGHGAPLVSSFAAAPSALVLGNTTNLTVVATGATPLSYAFSGLPAGCVSANSSTLSCTPTSTGTYSVTVVVLDVHHNATSVATNVTVYPAGGGAGLAVRAFTTSPGTVLVNGTTYVQVVASGGVGPLAYSFSGLPPGCASANVSTLACTPTAPGVFGVAALVTDAAGHHAGVRTILDVIELAGAAPEISALVATPAIVLINESLTLVVAVGGGELPLTFAFAGLPVGCQNVNAPVLTCQPTTIGNYSVSVNVTDAAGRAARATTEVSVRGPSQAIGAPSPGPIAPSSSFGPLIDAGLAVAGAALVAAFALAWNQRERRREGERLVAQLDEGDPDIPTPRP
ncbi:MAG: hypothetical protein L3K17_05615 [Thermoplasmata archaeon]|nr:hypothetical protein [Thermoplasmata archaeon]